MSSPSFLPPEIIDLIIHHLWETAPETPPLRVWEVDKKPTSHGLASYATISRIWQFAIERYTFASIVTFSDDLPELKRIVGNCARRRSHVKELWFSIDLPLYSVNRQYLVERPEEHKANLATFQQGVHDIWDELSRWARDCPRSGVRLVLNADAPVNRNPKPSEVFNAETLAGRWQHPESFLALDVRTKLPLLPLVSELGVSFEGRHFHPSAIKTLILSLPAVRQLHLFIGAPKPTNHELRAEHREILARALSSPTLHQLEFLSIRMWYDNPNNHSWDMSPAHDPVYPQGDVLNRAICTLAQRSLRYLNLMGAYPISPALWGAGEDGNATDSSSEIIFPYLEKVYIEHSHITYDGRWLYTGHPEAPPLVDTIDPTSIDFQHGEYPLHDWRVRPDPETYNPLLRSMARAVLNMPNLRSLRVEFYARTLLRNRIMMQIAGPGEKAGVLHWARKVEDDVGEWRWIVLVEEDLENWEVPAGVYRLMKTGVGEDGVVIVQRFP
ncbi:hypothetical protein BJX65DRAFT_284733 [Aspergillus insuetus]